MVVLLRFTVFRTGFEINALAERGDVNFKLFGDLMSIAKNSMKTFLYLAVGNIVAFMPFGFYSAWRIRKHSVLLAAVCGLVLSVCIESLQYLLGTGVAEIDDVILNTLGALLGALLERAAVSVRRRIRVKSEDRNETET
ncbi:MAG: VanZ family protein [Oscillospiraceae bacterium]|jgi:glycopeptide antibiotics resistance protein